MNKVKQASAVIVGLLCLATLPATAQNKGKALGKAVEATVGRKVAQQTVKNGYNPVLGYESFRYKVPGSHSSFIGTTLKEGHRVGLTTVHTPEVLSEESLLQVAPITNAEHANKAFKKWGELLSSDAPGDQITPITQAFYMWRLANPGASLETTLAEEAENVANKAIGADSKGKLFELSSVDTFYVVEMPTLRFLENLLDCTFTPKSYAQLAKETRVYPKHITLNAQGFPIPTAQAKEARILDNYLLLAKKDKALNNEFFDLKPSTNDYNTFVLTAEEKQAADKLLSLRKQGDALPKNPTPRQLLENIYNQMEREVFPYNDPTWKNIDLENTTEYMSTYPFKDTPAELAIQDVLAKAGGEIAWQHSYDMAHLMVVESIIHPHLTGEELRPISYYENLLKAFERVWNETPRTAENIAHLKVLQKHVVTNTYDLHEVRGETNHAIKNVLEKAREINSWEL